MADLLAALDQVLATADGQALSLESAADRARLRELVAAELARLAEIARVKIRGVDFPCEECSALKGSRRDDKGFMRCTNCGYPSP